MRAGELDTLITILEPGEYEADAMNESVAPFVPLVDLFAKRSSRPGREFFQSGRTVNETRVYFTIRAYPSVTTQHRVRHGATVYEITDVRESDKRGGPMQLECKAVE